MATTTNKAISSHFEFSVGAAAVARFALVAVLPLAAFGATNIAAEALGVLPLFFSPVGLAGWMGAAIHLALLASLGLSLALALHGGARPLDIAPWAIAFTLGTIAYPYLAPSLDSLALALTMTGIFMLGLATSIRVARHSALAGWILLPVLGWIGFGACLGLAVTAAFSPPFALVNAQQPTPAAS